MSKRNSALTPQIVPRDLELEFKRMVAQFIEEQVQQAMSHKTDAAFQPFFQTREIAREIKRRQTITEQKKFVYAYEDWGCLVCGTKEQLHRSLWMCGDCYTRSHPRLLISIRKRAPSVDIPQPTFMDSVRMAQASLLVTAELAVAKPKAFGPNPMYAEGFTKKQAAKAAGVAYVTLHSWLVKGLLTLPEVKLSDGRWLWTDEDVERIKALKNQRAIRVERKTKTGGRQ
jgi:hypothetical protein